MTIDVACPSCGKPYRVPDDRAGQRFRCKQCSETVSVPGGADEWGGLSNSAVPDPYGTSNPYTAPNPYSMPAGLPAASGRRVTDEAIRTKVMLPAIFLYCVAGLSLVVHLVLLVLNVAGIAMQAGQQRGNPLGNMMASGLVGIAQQLLLVAMDTLVIVGAYNLHKRKSYGLAMTGAIIACIPCCGPCAVLGIPFGIWALVILNDHDVKRSF